jgi:anthranilate synthase/aminodeoxychorismate synthase-like glutamine amidotransferase
LILVIDNYDSFTYNLVQYLGQCGAEVIVKRNDQTNIREIESLRPAGIMLSPGPCDPNQSGICLRIVDEYFSGGPLSSTPLFGVCLGHQAIGQVAGGQVRLARTIMHGKASMVRHDGLGLFEGMPNPFSAIRYHSLVVSAEEMPDGFEVTATAEDDGEMMGLRHRTLPIEGVQFHPESVLTQNGFRIVENFAKRVAAMPKG